MFKFIQLIDPNLNSSVIIYLLVLFREHSGSVVESLTRDRAVAGFSLSSVTALCP